MKRNIAVVFGGKSSEHDISIITAIQCLGFINKEKYNVHPIYISKDGEFLTGDPLFELDTFIDFNRKNKSLHNLTFGNKEIFIKINKVFSKSIKIDCAILCCHGAYGEDGCLQGLLEFSQIPYSSCGVCSSSICMNKKFMKDVFIANKIPIVKHLCISRYDFQENSENTISYIEKMLSFPVIVKPANSGSSIGISKAKDISSLKSAIELACLYDKTIIIEKCIENLIEINCAVLKVGNEIIISNLEQPITRSDILTFDEKYLGCDNKTQKQILSENEIELPKSILRQIKNLAKRAFICCDCDGVVRIDFLYDCDQEKVFVNEINTIPGSMANYLFSPEIDFPKLLDLLVESSIQKDIEKQKNTYSFKSTAILSYLNSSKKIRSKIK